MDARDMAELRIEIAELRADLRDAEDTLVDARALAREHLYRDNPGGIGSNELERKHRIEMAELLDSACDAARVALRNYQRKLAVAEARLDGARDIRVERGMDLAEAQLDSARRDDRGDPRVKVKLREFDQ